MRVQIIGLTLVGFVFGLPQKDTRVGSDLIAAFSVFEGVGAISFFGNGDMCAVSYDREKEEFVVMVWDIPKRKLVSTFRPKIAAIGKLDLSPNDKLIFLSDDLGNNDIYSRDGQLVSRFKVFEFGAWLSGNACLDTTFLNDDEVLLVTPKNVAVRRNIATSVSKLYYLDDWFANGATIARDSNTLSWVNGRFAFVWRPMLNNKPGPVLITATNNHYVRAVCSDNGLRLLCATSESEFGLYNVTQDKLIKKWNGHGGSPIANVIPIKENKGFVSACEDGETKVWRQDGELARTIRLAQKERIYTIGVSRDSSLLAIGTSQNKILVYDLKQIVEAK